MGIQIRVNGAEHQMEAGSTLADLVRQRGLQADQVAIEVNQELVPRAERAEHRLQDGDAVELVTLVGGG